MSNDASNDVKDKGGRPSQLTPELIAKAEMYLTDYMSNDDIVPSVSGLACYLEISRSSVYNYKDKSNRFLDIVERVELLQEKMLINGGLKGDFNAAITKLMMAKRGYSDSQNIDHTTGGKEIKAGLGHFYGRGDDDGDSDT